MADVIIKDGTAHITTESSDSSGSFTSKNEIEERLIELKKRIRHLENIRINLIESLGIFVALFTFISINIQIFSKISSLNNALIFVCLLFLCLAGFVIILHLVLNGQPWGFVLILVAVVILMFVLYFTKNNIPLSIEEDSKVFELEQQVKILEKRVDDLNLRR